MTRQRLTKEDRRAQLLAAAEVVFAARGHAATTFEDIAAEAQVTRPLIYGHFTSLDEIYLECHRAAREEMEERLMTAAGGAGSDPRAQLHAGLTAYFEFVREFPQRWVLLYGPGAGGGAMAEQTAELRFVTAERMAALFLAAAPHISHDEAVTSAHIVSGASEQLARWWQRHPSVALDDVVERMMAAVWGGLETMLAGGGAAKRPAPPRTRRR